LPIIGSTVFVTIPSELRPKSAKFDTRSEKGQLIGQIGNSIYVVYVPTRPQKARVIKTSHVRLLHNLPNQPLEAGNKDSTTIEPTTEPPTTTESSIQELDSEPDSEPQPRLLRSNKIHSPNELEPTNLRPVSDLQVLLPEVHNKESYTKFDDSTLLTSTLDDLVLYDSAHMVFSTTGYKEPTTLQQAYSTPEKSYWKKAVETEIKQLLLQSTITPVSRTQVLKNNKSLITTRWFFKRKIDKNGNIDRYKARLVARGFQQIYGLDYFETFATGTKPTTLRLLLALSAYHNYEIEHIDITNAFLHSQLEEEIYLNKIDGLNNYFQDFPQDNTIGYHGDNSQVLRLNKPLYGLKQSPRNWQQTVKTVLATIGFFPLISDESTYYNKDLDIYIITYVDDFLLFGLRLAKINKVKQQLAQHFKINDLGPASYFLGIQIFRNRQLRHLKINQSTYIQRMLENLDLLHLRSTDIPISPGLPKQHFLESAKNAKNPANYQLIKQYQQLIGSLMYAMTQTRPDLAYSIAYLSRYLNSPTPLLLKAAKSVFRYLASTNSYSIVFSTNYFKEPILEGFSDSDFAGDYDTRKSTYGYLFKFNNAPISWKTKRQSTIALSTTEAEFNSLEQAICEAIWLKNLISELNYPLLTIPIKRDNLAFISLTYNPEFYQRTKHTALYYYYIR
jgi:hypothetical protein